MTQSGVLHDQNETLHDRRRCVVLVCGGDFAEIVFVARQMCIKIIYFWHCGVPVWERIALG